MVCAVSNCFKLFDVVYGYLKLLARAKDCLMLFKIVRRKILRLYN